MFVCTLHTSVGTFQKLLTGKEIWRTLCKFSTSNFYGSKPDSLLFVFAEKPTSVEIIDKADVLQKDKPVTVRSTHLSAACVFSTEYKYVPTQGLNSFFTLIELSISIISKPPLVHGNTSRLGTARLGSQKTVDSCCMSWHSGLRLGAHMLDNLHSPRASSLRHQRKSTRGLKISPDTKSERSRACLHSQDVGADSARRG